MTEIRKILLPTDFSDCSMAAFEPARTLAEKFGADIVLAHVEETRLPPLVVEYATVGMEEIQRRQEEQARDQLHRLAVERLGGDVQCIVALGTPHDEIVRLAVSTKADLVVMATHGRGFISHAILGSTTERVVRRAACAVFVVRGCDD